MKKLSVSLLTIAVPITGWLCFSCSGDLNPVSGDNRYSQEASFSEEAQISQKDGLRLEGITGTITITGSAAATNLQVAGVRRVEAGSRRDAETQLELLQVEISENDDEVVIRTLQPDDTDGRNFIVDYDIILPDTKSLKVFNVTGIIEISSINNTVVVENTTGEIVLDNIEGDVEAELVTGVIDGRIDLPRQGRLNLSTVTGNIGVDIPKNTSALLNAGVVTGNISLANLTLQDAQNGGNSLTGKLGDGDGTITIRAVTGNINIAGY
jgi:hypothetical protein